MLTILLNVFKCKEVTTCMIKYTVKDNLNSFFVTDCYEIFEIFVSTQTGIKLLIISGFISMTDTLK